MRIGTSVTGVASDRDLSRVIGTNLVRQLSQETPVVSGEDRRIIGKVNMKAEQSRTLRLVSLLGQRRGRGARRWH